MYSRNPCGSRPRASRRTLGQIPGGGAESSSFGWTDAVLLVPAVADAWRQATGGDQARSVGCWTGYKNAPYLDPCPNTPDYDWVKRWAAQAPQLEIDTAVTYLLGANSGKGPKNRADLSRAECIPFWVKALLGGKGCVASKFPEAPDWFRSSVQTYGAPLPGQEFPGSSLPLAGAGGAGLATLVAGGLALVFLPKMLGKG